MGIETSICQNRYKHLAASTQRYRQCLIMMCWRFGRISLILIYTYIHRCFADSAEYHTFEYLYIYSRFYVLYIIYWHCTGGVGVGVGDGGGGGGGWGWGWVGGGGWWVGAKLHATVSTHLEILQFIGRQFNLVTKYMSDFRAIEQLLTYLPASRLQNLVVRCLTV